MTLSSSVKKALKAKAHYLDPVILIGQKGITPSVLQEIDLTLEHHELIKIRFQQGDKVQREAFTKEIIDALSAELVGQVGRISIIYRKRKET